MKAVFCILAAAVLLAPAKAQTAGSEQGIDVVDEVKSTATVEKIDLDKRKVTVLLDDGKHKTLKLGDGIRNLDQVRVGDHVKLTYAEEMIVLVGQTKEAAGEAAAGLVAIAPKGSLPGGVMVETTSLTGKVLAVDAEKRKVVLEEPDGKKKTMKLSKKVTNLDQLKPGETIDMVVTEALAIEMTH
jgi:Cu/Ag efflux protein CusF